jgi:Bacteriophage clamp loader A subunit
MKKSPSPFAYVDSVSHEKVDVLGTDEYPVSGYEPFMVNRALSFHADAILVADEMNVRPWGDRDMQYYFYLHALRSRFRRGSKWHKPEKVEDENLIMRTYQYNRTRARELLRVLKPEQLAWARSREIEE